jgi:hypothetical protein
MKFFTLVWLLGVASMAVAQAPAKTETTPLVIAKLPAAFKENTPTTLYFYSLTIQGVQQGGYCLGADCTALDGKIGYRTSAKDANGQDTYFVCASVAPATLKAGDVVGFNYTIDGNTTIYRRTFTVTAKGEGNFDLVQTSESVVQQGGPIQYATAPSTAGTYQQPAQAQNAGSGSSFIDILNQYRPGRPLIYDPSLNVNTATHHPPPGANWQIMGFSASFAESAYMWAAEGGLHTQYLMNGTYAGVAGGPGRWIVNLR